MNKIGDMKKIQTEEEAIRVFRGLIEDMTNGFPMNKELMKELEESWGDAVASSIPDMPDSVAEFAVRTGILSRDEAMIFLSKRRRTIDGDQCQRRQIINGNQDHASQHIKGDQMHVGQLIEGDQCHVFQTIKGDQDNKTQTIRGSQYNFYQFVGGEQFNNNQTIKGEIHIQGLKQGDKELQKKLNKFYKSKQDKYTWGTFFRWLMASVDQGRPS